VRRAVDAMGGAAAVDDIRSLVIVAENVRHGPEGAIPVRTTTYFQFPYNVRHEMNVGGKRIALVSTLDGAVLVTPEGSVDLSSRARVAVETPAMRNPVALLKSRTSRDVSFAPLGPDRVGDAPVDKVEMKVGPHQTVLVFESSTGRLLQQKYRAAPGDDVQGDIVVTYADFRSVPGSLVYPFASRAEADGKLRSETRITELRVNERLDSDLFPSPEGSPDRPPPSERGAEPR
jgi:hypothetical protein